MSSTPDATAFVKGLLADDAEEIVDLEVRRASSDDTYLTMVAQHESGDADRAASVFEEAVA